MVVHKSTIKSHRPTIFLGAMVEPMSGQAESFGKPASVLCAYCLEPLNAGARACKACRRKQPAGAGKWLERAAWALLLAVPLAMALWFGSRWHEASLETEAASQIAECAQAGPDQKITPDTIRLEIDAETRPGVEWRDAARWVAARHDCAWVLEAH